MATITGPLNQRQRLTGTLNYAGTLSPYPAPNDEGNVVWWIYDTASRSYVPTSYEATIGPEGPPGIAATIEVGAVQDGDTASVTNSGTPSSAVLDFVLPRGPQGRPGKDFAVLGYYATLDALRAAVMDPELGDSYGVGLSYPYDIYTWDTVTTDWINNGPIQGPPGPPGADGAQGPAGADGIQGPAGPNEISGETATTLTGIIKGDGSTVTTATPGEDYAAGKHAPQHAADGADPLTPGMIGALEYDDISGRSASGTFPRFDGVFPGTEMEHTVLYGKSTQDGTPSPDAPVEIVDFAPGSVWCGGRNLARLDDRMYDIPNVTVEIHKDTVRVSNTGSATTPISCAVRLRLPPTVLGKTVTAYFMAIGSNPSNAPHATLGAFDLNINNVNNAVVPNKQGESGRAFTATFPASMPDNIYPCLSLIVSMRTSLNGDYCDFTDIMIVEGEYTAETMPPYTPYTGATYPVPLTLRGIPVDEGGNYVDETGQQYIADTYDVVTGEYVQRCKMLVLDGTERSFTGYNYALQNLCQQINAVNGADDALDVLHANTCSHYQRGRQTTHTRDDPWFFMDVAGTPPANQYVFNVPKTILSQYGFDSTDEATERQTASAAARAYFAAQYAAGTPVTVLYALADPIVTHLDPQQVLAYSPTTQISAGGGYIGAKLGAAMAPVRTTPQELTQAQMLQALANLGLIVDTETGAVTWGTATAENETTEQTV